MKNSSNIICLSLLILTGTRLAAFAKDAPTSAEQLRSEVESALKAKDTNALMTLFNWQGVSENMKAMLTTEVAYDLKQEIAKVKLSPLPADFESTNEMNGIRYRPNVTIVGMIEVQFTQEGNATSIPYGKSGHAFYLNGTIEEKIPGPFTQSKALNVMVMGTADPSKFSGICIFVRNGKEIKNVISSKGNVFNGDYIKSCTIQKTVDDGTWLQLVIMEGDKQLFKSREVTNRDPLIYEKK